MAYHAPIFARSSYAFLTTENWDITTETVDSNPNKLYFEFNKQDKFDKGWVLATIQDDGGEKVVEDQPIEYKQDRDKQYLYLEDLGLKPNAYYNIKIAVPPDEIDETPVYSDFTTFRYNTPVGLDWTQPAAAASLIPQGKYTAILTEQKAENCMDRITAYRFVVNKNAKLVWDSGRQTNLQEGKISCPIDFNFYLQDKNKYEFIITYITQYGRYGVETKAVTVEETDLTGDINLSALMLPTLGVVRIISNMNLPADTVGNLTMQVFRSSSKNNYADWHLVREEIPYFNVSTREVSLIWDDRTVESGTSYIYRTQLIINTDKGNKFYRSAISDEVFCTFEHIFLTSAGAQVIVAYNPDVNGYKYSVNDTITPTIGGQYPFVRRVAANNYRTFTVGGLISYNAEMMAVNSYFWSDSLSRIPTETQVMMEFDGNVLDNSSIIFGQNQYKKLLNIYAEQGLSQRQKENYFERAFREQVIEFLYSAQPKIFRSETEGNILVRLTNVTLSPEKQLGRMVYTFSATATEIGPVDDANMELYYFSKPYSPDVVLASELVLPALRLNEDGTPVIAPESITQLDDNGNYALILINRQYLF